MIPDILWKIHDSWKVVGTEWNVIILWAAMCLCSHGFLLAGEAVASADGEFDASQHSYADVEVDNVRQPSYLAVQIKQSKTDPFRKGVQVIIGHTGGPLCPVTAISFVGFQLKTS